MKTPVLNAAKNFPSLPLINFDQCTIVPVFIASNILLLEAGIFSRDGPIDFSFDLLIIDFLKE